jgi:hypothetical protein
MDRFYTTQKDHILVSKTWTDSTPLKKTTYIKNMDSTITWSIKSFILYLKTMFILSVFRSIVIASRSISMFTPKKDRSQSV